MQLLQQGVIAYVLLFCIGSRISSILLKMELVSYPAESPRMHWALDLSTCTRMLRV